MTGAANTPRRVFGIDAGHQNLLESWIAAGAPPHLVALVREGSRTRSSDRLARTTGTAPVVLPFGAFRTDCRVVIPVLPNRIGDGDFRDRVITTIDHVRSRSEIAAPTFFRDSEHPAQGVLALAGPHALTFDAAVSFDARASARLRQRLVSGRAADNHV